MKAQASSQRARIIEKQRESASESKRSEEEKRFEEERKYFQNSGTNRQNSALATAIEEEKYLNNTTDYIKNSVFTEILQINSRQSSNLPKGMKMAEREEIIYEDFVEKSEILFYTCVTNGERSVFNFSF